MEPSLKKAICHIDICSGNIWGDFLSPNIFCCSMTKLEIGSFKYWCYQTYILQICKKNVWKTFVYDPLWRIVNSNFVMLQQKNFVALEITSYMSWQHLFITASSQLLLAQFWPNIWNIFFWGLYFLLANIKIFLDPSFFCHISLFTKFLFHNIFLDPNTFFFISNCLALILWT